MGYALGVDLGTTYSAAAVAEDGRVETFTLGTVAPAIPSVVVLRADGEVLVGEAAERRSVTEPARTAREFKRRLGDPAPLVLGGTPYGAEALMAHLLREIVEMVSERQGRPPDRIVVTHPANYGPYKRDLLAEMVRLADVRQVDFLTEPEAAAISYARQNRLEPAEVVAVYDFGGGTFDAAVLRKTADGFELLGQPEGMERLGGIDFDQAVFAHVDDAVGGQIGETDASDPATRSALARLRVDVRTAKEALSSDTDVTVPVMLPTLQTDVRMTRVEFEAMIRPRIGETITALERAVRSAGLTMVDVSRILLVGGSSRIPLVAEMVRRATGRPVAVDAHPKFAIALGAAQVGLATVAPSASEQATQPAAAEPVVSTVREWVPTPPPPWRVSRIAALGLLGLLFVAGGVAAVSSLGRGGGGSPSPDSGSRLLSSPTSGGSATPRATPTPDVSSTRPGILPAEVDAAFCRFGMELGGSFQAANAGLAAALAALDVEAAIRQGDAFSASAQRMREDLEIAESWAPIAGFSIDMRTALDEYERTIGAYLLDPFNPAALDAEERAYARFTSVVAQLTAVVAQYPELDC